MMSVLLSPGFIRSRGPTSLGLGRDTCQQTPYGFSLLGHRPRRIRPDGPRFAHATAIGAIVPRFHIPLACATQLSVLHVYAAHHSRGVEPALLEAVVDLQESMAPWLADPNPRAPAPNGPRSRAATSV